MPETTAAKLELWRKQRERRRARLLAADLRREPKPRGMRPGGNPLTIAAAYDCRYDLIPTEAPLLGLPIPKHVPPNPHRVGSIAWSFFYHYILPGA